MGKYGEDSKLIYDLQDQGGELCSLRYDLTVPFARFLAMNKQYKQMKRYHIAKVYRRDQPVMTKGRFREFHQCDFDIAGTYEPMMPDAEIFKIITEVLLKLDLGEFKVRFNHRKILDGIFAVSGVPEDKFRSICSAVDKLDKLPWLDVRKEMLDKGLDEESADLIGEYVLRNGDLSLVDELLRDERLMKSSSAKFGLEQLQLLFGYLQVYKVLPYVSFDLGLARGLDYYTGVIYETVVASTDGVGSIAGGGRYDELVSMFTNGNHSLPCVGLSFGVERIFAIYEAKMKGRAFKSTPTQLLVGSVGESYIEERMSLVNDLWDAGISAEILYKKKAKLLSQFDYCEKNDIPLIVVIGPDELALGLVRLKKMTDREDKGALIPRADLINTVKSYLEAEKLPEMLNGL